MLGPKYPDSSLTPEVRSRNMLNEITRFARSLVRGDLVENEDRVRIKECEVAWKCASVENATKKQQQQHRILKGLWVFASVGVLVKRNR